ncbi:L,D-transpeptidase [Gryllotalpicola reticulitermitis]|uniref:L,D-transpeptidase n=1 Tax=Gryllotalpicola reticulitermitis TaxID=1184153 RepID=A0ABV8QAW7_9MICO
MTRAKLLGLWLGGASVVLVSAAVLASLVLIAPGVTVGGAPVGVVTQGVAEQNIGNRLATVRIRIGDAVVTGAELGASVDAHALARQARDSHPLWNPTTWNPGAASAPVTIDPAVALPALRAAAPQLFADAVNARVVFDEQKNAFDTVAAQPGRSVDLDDLASRLSAALVAGTSSVAIQPTQIEAEARATTTAAQAFAKRLNDQAATAGFYLGGERLEAVPIATVASWLTISADTTTGEFTIRPSTSAIDATVAGLAARVKRQPQSETVVTNSTGARLRVIREGRPGVRLATDTASAPVPADDAAGIAAAVADSLASGTLRFDLQGESTPFRTTTVFRRIEVDKSEGTTTLYEGPESGDEKIVARYPVAIGTGGEHETRDGRFTVYAQLATQDMGDCNGDHGFGYCTKDVPWVSYFNGDQGFHGTYWHDNFGAGARMSHGCVNMRIPDALALYRFAQVGTEVWVHD